MLKKKQKKKPLNWKYCECGCHCNTVMLNGQTYSHLLDWEKDKDGKPDFEKKKHYLHVGLRSNRLSFKSFKEMDDFVRTDALKRINFLG